MSYRRIVVLGVLGLRLQVDRGAVSGWGLVIGGWWLVIGDWWLVVGDWWMVIGDW